MAEDKEKQAIPWTYIIGVVITVIIAVAVLTVQWQTTIDKTTNLNEELSELEILHDKDIARLDESNRSRRNTVADLEERIAILEERSRHTGDS